MLPTRSRATPRPQTSPRKFSTSAIVFSALGDKTRLMLLTKLSTGGLLSITELASDSALSRQAITKHLRVLEQAGLIRSQPQGRENRFRFNPAPLAEARHSLDAISAQWDQALARLKSLVET
jgi:DNA-binding transcriptional ArsR family regulator